MDITIVIPVYNRKEYIRQTLASIPVSYPVILVDNGSTDGSYELLAQLVAERSNTRLATETIPGAAAARNKGLSLCRSKWVYFFDSDDIFTGIPPEWDETKDLICFPTRQQIGKRVRTRDYSPVTTPHTHILNSMLNTQSMIFRTKYLRELGGWDARCLIWDDWELGLRTLLWTSRVQWVTQQAYHVIRIHPDSLTGSSFSARTDRILKVLGYAFDDILLLQPRNSAAFAALFYRCYILSGQMRHEGHPEAGRKVREFIYERFHVNKQSHRMGQLLEWGAAKGVRGTWRMALWLVNRM